ncbi:abscisic acid receptor PYR1-like protein [Tanacetum coccineum]
MNNRTTHQSTTTIHHFTPTRLIRTRVHPLYTSLQNYHTEPYSNLNAHPYSPNTSTRHPTSSGLPANTSTERLDILDDEKRVMGFTIIGGEHRLRNYHAVTTVHEMTMDVGPTSRCVVLESYVVDVPEGNTEEDTRLFADTVVKLNLQKLASVTEAMARGSVSPPSRLIRGAGVRPCTIGRAFVTPLYVVIASMLESGRSVKGTNCGFIEWVDPPMCHRALDVIHGLLRVRNELEEDLEEQCLLLKEKENLVKKLSKIL